MTNYRKLNLWLGFLRLNNFHPHIQQPTDADIQRLRGYYPDLPEEQLLIKFAEQNECPDLDSEDHMRSFDPTHSKGAIQCSNAF